jgi:hypothetical protein
MNYCVPLAYADKLMNSYLYSRYPDYTDETNLNLVWLIKES